MSVDDGGGDVVVVDPGRLRRRLFFAAGAVLFIDCAFLVFVADRHSSERSVIIGLVLFCVSVMLCATAMAQSSHDGHFLIKADRKLVLPASQQPGATTFFEPTEATREWGNRVLAEQEDRV